MYHINITDPGTVCYPLHIHQTYEVMFYLEGRGYLKTQDKNYPFSPGSVIIVPPKTEHGSVSESGFKNISISGSFENLFINKTVVSFFDNDENEIAALAKLIYNNRYKNKNFLNALCSAFTQRLICEMDNKSQLSSAIDDIILKISENVSNISQWIRKIKCTTQDFINCFLKYFKWFLDFGASARYTFKGNFSFFFSFLILILITWVVIFIR